MTVHVISHATSRYLSRVAAVSYDEARAAPSSPAIAKAAGFGAPYVRRATGQRVVLDGRAVVTVLPSDTPAVYLGLRRGTKEGSCG